MLVKCSKCSTKLLGTYIKSLNALYYECSVCKKTYYIHYNKFNMNNYLYSTNDPWNNAWDND